jgi:hypothetical protein
MSATHCIFLDQPFLRFTEEKPASTTNILISPPKMVICILKITKRGHCQYIIYRLIVLKNQQFNADIALNK